jgi:2,3-bisphosphoglycerate-independent phosphoglycerate mutase
MPAEYLKPLLRESDSKIVLLILDGLGGLPMEAGRPTELEAARTPVMDRLAAEGTLGQIVPIRPGVTPGSGPAHLALFGYDPLTYLVGRGALEATGVGIDVQPGDVAARGNFATLAPDGTISDRRAGRIPTDEALPLVDKLKEIEIPGVEVQVKHVKEYRFAVLMRGEGLSAEIEDTDPLRTGLKPLAPVARDKASEKAAKLYAEWIEQAQNVLKDQPKANGMTLRGFGTDPRLPKYQDVYGLKAACVAVYPMYKGVSQLVGMDVIRFEGESPQDEFDTVARIWEEYDFQFCHIKKTDSMGEDGNFDGKVGIIESVDAALGTVLEMQPDVLIITGDHGTPSKMKYHSWHPVPLLLWAPERGLRDQQTAFGERACALGGLGTFPATDIMPLALAHAGRLDKFGA